MFPILSWLLLCDLNLLLDLLEINMRHLGIITIEDLSQLLESGTPGLDVEEVDEAEFDEDPNRIDERQVPVVRKVLPRNWVGITNVVSFIQKGGYIYFFFKKNLLSENQWCLYRQVHNHDTLGAQAVGQNLDRVGDEKTRPGNGVEYREEPDKDDLWVAGSLDILGSFVNGGNDSPGEEHENHAWEEKVSNSVKLPRRMLARTNCGNQEKWSSSDSVNEERTWDTDNQTE